MSQFTTKLCVEPLDGKFWRLTEGFEYHVGYLGSGEIIKVPEGFITDFASVPRPFWPIINPIGKHGKAAVIHDYCYTTACNSRSRSDYIFWEGMGVLNVTEWKREVMYKAVVYFGWWAWYKHRNRELRTK